MAPRKPAKRKTEPPRRRDPLARLLEGRGEPWTVAVLLAVLVVVFFWEILQGRYFFWEDFLEQNYQYRFFAATWLRQGVLPFWNPYIWAGLPFVGDVQAAVFYPLNLALTLFVKNGWLAYRTVEIQAILHVWFAGLGAYLALRLLRFSTRAALPAAVAYMFSARLIVEIIHLNSFHAQVWFPLIFALFVRGLESRFPWRWFAGAGLLTGMAALGGYPQAIVWLFFLLLTTAGVWMVLERQWGRPLAALVVVFGIGVGIALVQYLPTVPAFLESVRAHYSRQELLEISLDPARLLTFLVPKFFGAVEGGRAATYWGSGALYMYWELAGYLGLAGLLLWPLAWRNPRRFLVWTGYGLIGVGLLLALGRYSPVYLALFQVFLPFHHMRSPSRFLILTTLGNALILGLALEQMPRWRQALKPWVFWLGALAVVMVVSPFMFRIPGAVRTFVFQEVFKALILLAVSGGVILWIRRAPHLRAPYLALAGVLFVDLYLFGHAFHLGTTDPRRYFARNRWIQTFQDAQAQHFTRVSIRAPGHILLPRNIGSLYRLYTLEGYNPLILERYSRVKQKGRVPRERVLDLYSAEFAPDPAQGFRTFARRTTYLPRAYVVFRYRVADTAQALRILRSQDFDPRLEVILEQEPGLAISGPDTLVPARILELGPNRIRVEADVPANGVLVLAENYYPLWKARLDGRPVPVIPANLAQRAVAVPAGHHSLEFYYDPVYFRWGLGGFVVALLVALALLFWPVSRKRKEVS